MEIVVGIDVSKDRLDVHVLPSGEAFSVGNDHAGMEDLARRLAAFSPTAIGLEA
ncbi:IS110 family transposase, partial [Mesorhizobium sp. M00.F.Ca.ET.151.01.1.1]